MTRMWCVDPPLLCRQHLLGEHTEVHQLAGSIAAGHSIDGYVEAGLVDTRRITSRHDELAAELERRGYTHDSPLAYEDALGVGRVDEAESLTELTERCERCAARIENAGTRPD